MTDIRSFFKPKPDTGQENCQSRVNSLVEAEGQSAKKSPVPASKKSPLSTPTNFGKIQLKKRSRPPSSGKTRQPSKKACDRKSPLKAESKGPLSDLLGPELSDKNDNKSDNKDMEEGAAKRPKLAGASTDFLSDLNNFLESSFGEEIDEDQKTDVDNDHPDSAEDNTDANTTVEEAADSDGESPDLKPDPSDSDLTALKDTTSVCSSTDSSVQVISEHGGAATNGDVTEKAEDEELETSQGEEYEVETIIDYQLDKVTMKGMFKVHWKGWSDADDTWETIENLTECQEELKSFYLRRSKARLAVIPQKRRSLQIPPLANLTSVLNKEEIGLLKKETEVEKPKKSQPGRTSSQNGTEEPETDPDKPPDPEFEVEHIVNYQFCKITMKGMYLVHWKGWPDDSDTWETMENLTDCKEMLKDFYIKRLKERENVPPSQKRFLEVPPDPRTSYEKTSDFADRLCPPPCQWVAEQFMKDKHVKWPEKKLAKRLEWMCKRKNPKEEELKELKDQLMFKHVDSLRKDQLRRLKEWQDEVNQLDQKAIKITVENEHDLEGPPRYLNYINKYYPSNPSIIIPDDPIIGCECETCDVKSERSCCPGSNGHMMAYNKFGRLRIDPGAPIYECNKKCGCGSACYNRVVQKGRKIKLCVYRTPNGCGWGVKTMENIKKGSFVVEYVGEVITSEEAEERGKKYDAEGRTYLFDLDFNMGEENKYTVDAALHGNISHFINHSCDPNLAIFNVWIDCLDPDLPRLCMFAVRDIVKGEQITFDYRQKNQIEPSPQPSPPLPSSNPGESEKPEGDSAEVKESEPNEEAGSENSSMNKMECRCGAANCRKILFC